MSSEDVTADLKSRVQALLEEHEPASTVPREFLGAQYDAGLAWVHLPQGFGGLGLPRKAQEFVDTELSAAGAPVGGTIKNFIGMGMAAPTIAAFGTDEQKRKFLRPLFTGEQIYCQLFSEPGAGSDLAGVATRAVRDAHDPMTGSSTGRRCGRRWPSTRRWPSWSPAPTRRCPNTLA